jgi:methionyl-tRNA formyltransferase
VDAVIDGCIEAIEQEKMVDNTTELKSAPKIFKETCKIKWSKDVNSIYNFIRGLSPYPAAWAELKKPPELSTTVKIFAVEKISETHTSIVGSIRTDEKRSIDVAVTDGYIRILSLQLAGKKRMNVDEFLRGFKLTKEHYFD